MWYSTQMDPILPFELSRYSLWWCWIHIHTSHTTLKNRYSNHPTYNTKSTTLNHLCLLVDPSQGLIQWSTPKSTEKETSGKTLEATFLFLWWLGRWKACRPCLFWRDWVRGPHWGHAESQGPKLKKVGTWLPPFSRPKLRKLLQIKKFTEKI